MVSGKNGKKNNWAREQAKRENEQLAEQVEAAEQLLAENGGVPDVTPEGMVLTPQERLSLNQAHAVMQMNAMTMRSELLTKLLNPGKDINFECGYPDVITPEDYRRLFERFGIAARVVTLMPEESWAIEPAIYETEDSNETEFEKALKELEDDKHLLANMQLIDMLSGIGRFGILLMGIDDGKELKEPVEGINLKTGEKAGNAKYKLLFLKAFEEVRVVVDTKETDVTSPRYGMPTMYSVIFEDPAGKNTSQTVKIHWTRVIHIADNLMGSTLYGTPRMKPVYNYLLDLRKVLGGSGEMFWKGGFPGHVFEVNPEMGDTTLDTDSIKEQMRLYSQGLQRYMAVAGVTVKSLPPQVADPSKHLESNIKAIAISLGIPYRIFLGTEEAKLASSQDVKSWNKRLNRRQIQYISPMIIIPVIDRLIAFGVLPEAHYFVVWPDLNTPTDEDVANVALKRTEGMAKYVAGRVDALIPPKEYLIMVQGYSQEEADAIMEAQKGYVADNPNENDDEDEDVNQ